MGILDSVFAGETGLVASLHRTLGGTATVKFATFQKGAELGTVETTFESVAVPFVPDSGTGNATDLNAPKTSRSDFKEPVDILSGSIPISALNAAIRPEKDFIEYQGIEYLITRVETTRVGDCDVMCTITATRAS